MAMSVEKYMNESSIKIGKHQITELITYVCFLNLDVVNITYIKVYSYIPYNFVKYYNGYKLLK